MRRALVIVAVLTVVGGFWVLFSRFFTLEDAKRIAGDASAVAERTPLLVFCALALAQGIGMVFSLPSKAILTLLAGALLGTWAGALSSMIGVASGTTVLFFAARFWLRDRVRERLGDRAAVFERRLAHHPIRALIGLRMLITLPYGPITLAAALTSMRYRHFLAGSLLGDLPVNVAYCYAGRQLYLLTSVSDAISPTAAGGLLAAGLFIFVTAIVGKKKRSRD